MPEIKAGDLVMVVRPSSCCGSVKWMGSIFTAGPLTGSRRSICICGNKGIKRVAHWPDKIGFTGQEIIMPIDRLIRIDPPAQPEVIDTEREVQT